MLHVFSPKRLIILNIFCLAVLIAGACKPPVNFNGGPTPTPSPNQEPPGTGAGNNFNRMILAGYQGWFVTPNIGPHGSWRHWAEGGEPSPGNVRFDLFPDVREFNRAVDGVQAPGLGNLGDGSPAWLYSSEGPGIIDTHFKWMRDNGIDGVSLERFVHEASTSSIDRELRLRITRSIRQAAEKYGRYFTIMVDISSMDESDFDQVVINDWVTQMEANGIPQSPNYAKQDGRPVVLYWGVGLKDRPGNPGKHLNVINWFKARGYYVVNGVAYDWRTPSEFSGGRAGFEEVYKAGNMIQPWAVGAHPDINEIPNHYETVWKADKKWCDDNRVEYQRVIYPGFSWANWNGGNRNAVPRLSGDFMWAQFYYTTLLKGTSAMIAMFDEFDEGTAIAKAAESAAMVPSNQWFLTLDADGKALSSDFYLRLTGEGTKMLKIQRPLTDKIPIQYNFGGN